MHGAPSVSYPVGSSRNARRLLLAVWTSGACCAAAAFYSARSVDWRCGLLVLSVLLSAAAAWRAPWARNVLAKLNFDGQHWSLSEANGLGATQVKVALDVQSSLLLYLTEADGARRWIWLDGNDMPERWMDLRRAVYSRAPSADLVAVSRRAVPTGPASPLS